MKHSADNNHTTATLSFDIEEFDFPLEMGRQIDVDTQMEVSAEGLNHILMMLNSKGLKATFYITANFAEHRPDMVRIIADGGHEIASHDFYHSREADSRPAEGKKVLEGISGRQILGYRAPRLASVSSGDLLAAGFRYNSSINPTWIPGRYNNLLRPRTVSDDGGLLIYPTSVAYPVRVPLFWLSLHLFPLPVYKMMAASALRHDGNLSLYFHPWEFSDRLKESAFGMPAYISACSGGKMRDKFMDLIGWMLSRGVRFVTTSEYLAL